MATEEQMSEGGVAKQAAPMTLPSSVSADNADIQRLREAARKVAGSWTNLARKTKTTQLGPRFEASVAVLAGLQRALKGRKRESLSEDLKWLSDNLRLVANDILELRTLIRRFQRK